MKTLGVDLAAAPENTAACVIDWTTGRVRLLGGPLHDGALIAAIRGVDVTAIDVPLGWPQAFVDAVVAHHAGHDWPVLATPAPADREKLRFRLTDRFVRVLGALPLSVSSDRIGVAAMRGARLQQLLRDNGVQIDRSGITGSVVEAYPAAALRAWGLTSNGYKSSKNRESCTKLARELAGHCGLLTDAVTAATSDCNDNGVDAFVCAVVARAARLGLTTPPPDADLATARREGWIHVPCAPIAAIVNSQPLSPTSTSP